MIRLTYPLFDEPVELAENRVNVIVLENQKRFRGFITELKSAIAGESSELLFSKDYEELSSLKNFDLIADVLSVDANCKKTLGKILSALCVAAVSGDMCQDALEIRGTINTYLRSLLDTSDCALTFDDITTEALLKSVNIRIDIRDTAPLDKLCDYLAVMSEYCGIECFIFVNLKTYLAPDELPALYQFSHYRKLHLILIENRVCAKLKSEQLTIIDEDLCQIS